MIKTIGTTLLLIGISFSVIIFIVQIRDNKRGVKSKNGRSANVNKLLPAMYIPLLLGGILSVVASII